MAETIIVIITIVCVLITGILLYKLIKSSAK